MAEEQVETNEKGGMGSKIPWFELLDFRALDTIARVFEHGARRYARDNWRACPVSEHLRHAIRHAYKYLENEQQYRAPDDQQLEDLSHFACRAIMALAVKLQDEDVADKVPKGLKQSKESEPVPQLTLDPILAEYLENEWTNNPGKIERRVPIHNPGTAYDYAVNGLEEGDDWKTNPPYFFFIESPDYVDAYAIRNEHAKKKLQSGEWNILYAQNRGDAAFVVREHISPKYHD